MISATALQRDQLSPDPDGDPGHASAQPGLPAVVALVLAPGGGQDLQLVALVEGDSALTGRVLRAANSPAYQPRMPIITVAQAQAKLGRRTFAEIAAAAALRQSVFHAPALNDAVTASWRMALARAAFAKEITRMVGGSSEDTAARAFIAGLLSEVGHPVALRAAMDRAAGLGLSARTPDGRAIVLLTAEALAAEAGPVAVRSWKLPQDVSAAIAHHAEPGLAGEHSRLAATVGLASILAHACAADESSDCAEAAASSETGCAPGTAVPIGTSESLTRYLPWLALHAGDVAALLGLRDRVRRLVDGLAAV